MAQRTPLYQAHLDSGARMVNFGGWDMPINYGSQIEEHHQVRRDAGLFDVSHMTVVDLHGEQVVAFLRHLLANDVDKLKQPGKAMYTCMLTPEGGVVDDLIVYFMHQQWFRMVVNAATRDKDVNWLKRHAQTFEVEVKERPELAIVAVQGPQARQRFADSQNSAVAEAALALKRFSATQIGDLLIARTGYTGEDGFELILPAADAPALWQALIAGGVLPCGLGARDTLRLEAGMNLYGQDMDEDTSPLEAALGWTIAWAPEERDFIGREALLEQKSAGVQRALVGLVLEGKGVLRHGQIVHTAEGAGIITSGSFSPTLNESIALARIPKGVSGTVEVEIRGRHLKARIVRPPFVRDGQRCDGI